MNCPRSNRFIITATALVLTACAHQSTTETRSSNAVSDMNGDTEGRLTEIVLEPGFNAGLIDNENACRLWAQNRNRRNTRPCTGEAPSCGDAIEASKVSVVDVNEGSEPANTMSSSLGDARLVTEGFYRVPVQRTVHEATNELTRRVAREGCDMIVVGDEEWLSLRTPGGVARDYRYLRVQWGTQAEAAGEPTRSAP